MPILLLGPGSSLRYPASCCPPDPVGTPGATYHARTPHPVRTGQAGPVRRLVVTVVVLANAAVALLIWNGRSGDPGPATSAAGSPDAAWSRLDPEGRCQQAAELVTHPARWAIHCRWRGPGDLLQGQAYPPPAGPPPWDRPRIEIYLEESQTREEVANAIAHELGHMHHGREPAFATEWLEARALPADTPAEIWTEDYAEVFSALFSPPNDRWRAPTARPSPGALSWLRGRFFS